jgi:hypothetical protein
VDDELKKLLADEDEPENIKSLREELCKMHKASRGKMATRFENWDQNLRIYKGISSRDQEDLEARKNREPEKFVVPMTYTQVQTFVTFAFLLYKQNQYFYEFLAQGPEDEGFKNISERLVQRDLNHNNWDTVLYNSLLDASRMGLGVVKSYWKKDLVDVPAVLPGQVTQAAAGPLASVTAALPTIVAAVKYEGNCVVNVDPYKFLPDLRLPLTRWREGQFVADECEYHISKLREWEAMGLVAGVELLSPMQADKYRESSRERFSGIEQGLKGQTNKDDFMVCVTEGQYRLVPSKYGLGPETKPVVFFIRIANDQRIISIDRSKYIHNEFIYDVGQFSPDNQSALGMALSDVIYALQDVVTWLINSRIMSVRRSLDNHLVIDTTAVDMSTVNSRGPFITLKKGVSARGTGIQNFIQQLKINDTTARHMEDADTLMKIMQMVTGVNENAMGQYAPGRRSATENRAANAGAASRMKMTCQLLWSSMYGPLGQKLLVNQRQEMSLKTFQKILGQREDIIPLWNAFHPANPADLLGMEDFFVFDGTVASEKIYMAQALQDMLQAIMANPESIGMIGYDVNKIFDEIQLLRGISNAGRFKLTRPELRAPAAGLPIPGAGGGVPAVAPAGAGPVPPVQPLPAQAGGAY